MKPIKSLVLAYCTTLAYSMVVVVLAFLFQDALLRLGEDWSEHVVVGTLAMGTIALARCCASIPGILFSIMGFQNGVMIPVLLISLKEDYRIDWLKFWIVLGVISVVTFVTVLFSRWTKQRKTRLTERGTHG